MRPETELIFKLMGKVVGEATPIVINNSTKGKLPSEIQRRISSYDLMTRCADSDLVAMLALSELSYKRHVRPLAGKDENELNNHYKVNLFDASATSSAIDQMQSALRNLALIKMQCEAMKGVAIAIVGKSAMLGPANASQIGFDTMVKKKIDKKCDQVIAAISKITVHHRHLMPVLNAVEAAHEGLGK